MSLNERSVKLITVNNRRSPVSEAYRTLRTNMQFASIEAEARSVMVTSAGPGEGKSVTISNLAVVTAQAEKRVLLIDADLRKPTLHQVFERSNVVGLSTALVGHRAVEECIQQTHVDGLDLMTSGPIPPNPAEMIGSSAMKRLLEQLENTYDMVLIDSPPTIAVTDAQLLSTIVDGVLLVVGSGKTGREMGQKAAAMLRHVNARILGAVLNRKKLDKATGYYYYYYSQEK